MKIKYILAYILAFSVLFCGCEDKKSENNEVFTETKSETPEESPKNEEISVFSYKPDTLCPLLSQNKANINVLRKVFDGLFDVDSHLNATPALAESIEAFDENKRFVVNLKKNISFHNGSKFGADDVIYSAKVIKSNEESPYAKNLSKVASVKKTGEYQVEFNLLQSVALFANLLDFPIIKSSAQMPDKENFNPVGTGAFIYENRNEGNLFYLLKNPNWWGGEVAAQTVRVRLLPDKDTALYAFSSGDISICPAEGDEWGKFVDSENSSYITYPTENFYFLGFNHKNSLLKNDEVRKAVFLALDKEEIFKSAVMDFGTAASFPINSEWVFCPEEKGKGADQKGARELLEKNDWKLLSGVYKKSGRRGQSLKFGILVCSDSYKAQQIAKATAETLVKFGIQAEVKKVDYEKYCDMINKKSYDMFIGKVLLAKDLDYSIFFGEENMLGAEDEELFAAMQKVQKSQDSEELKENLQSFEKLANEKAPFVGFGFEKGIMLVKNRFKNGLLPSVDNIYFGLEKLDGAK